jgi:hypothetical protein
MLTNDLEALRMIDNVLDLIYYDRENLSNYTWKEHAVEGDGILAEIAELVGHKGASMFLVDTLKMDRSKNYSQKSQAEAWMAVCEVLGKAGMWEKPIPHDGTGQGLAVAFIQHILDRMNTAERIIENYNLCHDKHRQVGVEEFSEGCADEQRKHYGCAPDAEDARKWRELVEFVDEADARGRSILASLYTDGSMFLQHGTTYGAINHHK